MSGQISISGQLIPDNNYLAGYLETSGLFSQGFRINRAGDMVLQVSAVADNTGIDGINSVNVDFGGNGGGGNDEGDRGDGGGSGRGRRVRNSLRVLQRNVTGLARRGSRVFSSNGYRRRSMHHASHEATATNETISNNSNELHAHQGVENRDSATQTDELVSNEQQGSHSGSGAGGMGPPFSLNYDRNLQRFV